MANSRVAVFGISDELARACTRARELTLVAPFISSPGLRLALDSAPKTCVLTVYTRWRPSEVASGASDPRILRAVEDRGGTLCLYDDLHAKVYLADRRIALVGSANLTERGLGVRPDCNLEAVVILEPPPVSLFVLLKRLQLASKRATEADLEEALLAASHLGTLPATPFTDPAHVGAPIHLDLPRLRTPDRLYELYCDLEASTSEDETEQALTDLAILALPSGLDALTFREAVAHRLKRCATIVDLFHWIEVPRRFGEVTEWVKARGLGSGHKERQRMAQTLIRWVLWFLPDYFRLTRPKYSEVLSRPQGAPTRMV